MKAISFLTILAIGLTFQSCGQKPADKQSSKATATLYQTMFSRIEKGIMIGHQDDLVYGHAWNVEGVSDVKQSCGDFPAVFGWELGDLELGNQVSLDAVSFDNIRNQVKWVNSQGGVNSFSWHCNNHLTNGNAWDISSDQVVKSILPGGEKNEVFVKSLERLADFFNSLKTDDGEAIPIIFRPWHEYTGSWFWWGQKLCTKDEYIALWKYTVAELKARGVHNVLYAYSSASRFKNAEEYLERYPGDEIVDIIGFDEYQGGINGKESYIKSIESGMNIIIPIATERKKIPILAETGCESVPDSLWWTGTLLPAIKDFPIAYVLMWRNAHDKPNHFYMVHPEHPSLADFKEFYTDPKTLFLNDLK